MTLMLCLFRSNARSRKKNNDGLRKSIARTSPRSPTMSASFMVKYPAPEPRSTTVLPSLTPRP